MNNVCVCIKSSKSELFCTKPAIAADVFSARGYVFDEFSLFSAENEQAFLERIQHLKHRADTILVLAPSELLPFAFACIAKVFGANARKAELENAGIYDDGKCVACVVSEDDKKTGAPYANEVCIPYLEQRNALRQERLLVKTVGANPVRLDGLLADLQRDYAKCISIQDTRKYGEDEISLFYNSQTPKMLIDDILRVLAQGLDDSIYALEDISLEQQLVRLLKLRGKKLSVAESFTGGGIARKITSVSGASEVYFEGLNTYDERAKMQRLGVSEYTLKTLGAVSDKTAYEMSLGLLRTGNCDISIATTGLAGPKSDGSGKPVGLCYIAVGTNEKISVYRYQFDGSREEITEKAIRYALFLAYKTLKNM